MAGGGGGLIERDAKCIEKSKNIKLRRGANFIVSSVT